MALLVVAVAHVLLGIYRRCTLHQYMYLECSLVELWQHEDEQVECPDLLLEITDVSNGDKRRQVLSGQQGDRKISTSRGDDPATVRS